MQRRGVVDRDEGAGVATSALWVSANLGLAAASRPNRQPQTGPSALEAAWIGSVAEAETPTSGSESGSTAGSHEAE